MNHDEKNVSFDIDKNGWIKLYRQLMKKAIWKCSTPEQKVILITLLLMADHEGNEWEWQGKKYKTEPGQFITSLKSIAEEAGKGISIQNVRTSLNKFKKYEFLTYESTKTGRLITITNWTIYQSNKEKVTKELTNDQQSTNKELTTNKNERIKEGIPLKKESKTFSDSDKEYKLSKYLSKCIAERLDKPLKDEKTLQSWAKEFNKMVRLDKYDYDEMLEVLQFSQTDDFWKKNILSAAKFRKQYLTLLAQMKG